MSISDLIKRNKALAEVNSQLVQQILSEVNAFLAIGIANKRFIPCILEGAFVMTDIKISNSYRNAGSGDAVFVFGVPLPVIINTKNLTITQIKIGLDDADATDYVDITRIFGWSDHTTVVTASTNNSDLNAIGEFIFDIADITVGGVYERINVQLNCVNATAQELDISYVQVEYYYN